MVENLTVLFPENDISFGDIHPGASTDYHEVDNGIFRYAAYRYELDGEEILQPVIDWVGEEPLSGTKFTYIIEFHPKRNQWERVRLVEVITDE